MKKILVPLLGCVLTLMALLALSGCGQAKEKLTLNVYNWGEYISDGSEGSLDTIRAFQERYSKEHGVDLTVNYDTFASNEDMYAKLSSGAVSYDVIIPSDYMIARLIEEDKLLPLSFDNIPNYEYIGESFRGLYYDPENVYSVPYTYGVIGVIYDANVVDESDAGEWDLLWNEKYSGSILQFNNPRDAFGTAMYKLGLDVNTTDRAVWDRAAAELEKQRPLLYAMVMDEIFNDMESGEAAIGAYYAGDYFIMRENQADNIDLQFYYPEETNYFVDAMCIPKGCQNQELAEEFINFMLSEEVAVANAEFIYYASPNSLVVNSETYREDLGEEDLEILYPDLGNFNTMYNKYAYRSLDSNTLDYINTLWESIKIN